jgi:NitT/TauT family transport system permease protein
MKRRSHHHFVTYASTHKERLYSVFIGPVFLIVFVGALVYFFPSVVYNHTTVPLSELLVASSYTLLRLFVGYALALICALPLAFLATYNSFTERIFLPVFDILESVPILAFFPLLILFFLRVGMPNGAAVFILFVTMLWNIVFTVAGGIKIIPRDILSASKVFGIKGWKYVTTVLLPAVFPEVVTGSILAFAQGWNIIIVAEVIHTYIPFGSPTDDLYGIGSVLVHASSQGESVVFFSAIAVMVAIIAIFNYFVWQNAIHYAERFKFE